MSKQFLYAVLTVVLAFLSNIHLKVGESVGSAMKTITIRDSNKKNSRGQTFNFHRPL